MEETLQQTPEVELLEADAHAHPLDEADYSQHTLEDFKKLFPKNFESTDPGALYPLLRKVKPYVDDILELHKQQALEKFIHEGGNPDDFELRPDNFFIKFDQALSRARVAYHEKIKEQQRNREQNLKKKQEILEKIRGLIDSAAKKNVFESFKHLQQEWKNIGSVPQEHNQELWSNYHALVNRFYDQRHIAFELIDLDRKKNLQYKKALVERAERLVNEPSIKKSLKELEEIHEEFKHIGPVPKDQQDEIWQRLKAASDAIHERRHLYLEEQKGKLEENLQKKLQILDRLRAYAVYTTDRIDEWATKTKEIEDIQIEWKNAGIVDREKVKEINKQFWDGLKQFYNNKRAFFKEIEAVKKENLKRKIVLCEKAEALQNDENFEKVSQEIIALQKQWKEIGHVPLKMKDKIYARFKKACDTFFENKRAAEKAQQEQGKLEIKNKLDFIQKLTSNNWKEVSQNDVNHLLNQWADIPATNGPELAKATQKLADFLKENLKESSKIDILEREKIVSRLYTQALNMSPDADKEKIIKEKRLRQEIRELENNIAQFKNNMEFFARAKNAEAIRKDFLKQIEAEEEKLMLLQTRLKILLGK